MGLQAKAIMFQKNGDDVSVLYFSPPFNCEGGKQFVYKNIIKAANVTIGVCTVQLLEF